MHFIIGEKKEVSALAQIRLSSHSLKIELERHNKPPLKTEYVREVIIMPLMKKNTF